MANFISEDQIEQALEWVRAINFDHAEDCSRNHYLAVSQLWIKGEHGYRASHGCKCAA